MTSLSTTSDGRRVLLVGVDGATLDLIEPWVDEGKLPNFATYFTGGTQGILRSTFHPISPAAWASFQTGMNPGKHGIIEFTETDLTAKTMPVSSQSIGAPPFWEYIGNSGKKVGLVNLFGTYPVKPVNGFLISGMLSSEDGRCSYPDHLLQEVKDEVGNYIIDAGAGKHNVRDMTAEQFIAMMKRMTEMRAEAAKYLIRTRDWDLFLVVFVSTDRIQHFFWKYMDSNRLDVSIDEREKYGDAILELYQHVDTFLGQLEGLVDDDTTKIVISDHGFGPVYRDVNVARWLYDHGYAHPKPVGLSSTYRTLKLLARKNLPAPILKWARSHYFDSSQRPSFYAGLPYDWSRTKVFPVGHFGKLFVNLKGREPQGIVEPGTEYESLCERLTEELMQWENPVNGAPLVKSVKRREDLYSGPFKDRMPDLSIEWTDYAYTSYHLSDPTAPLYGMPWREEGYGNLEYSANHRPDGIIMAKGKGIKKGNKIEDANIIDLAPTVLHLMGLGVPGQMDGSVLHDLFDPEDAFLARPISYAGEEEHDGPREAQKDAYSEKDVQHIEERLKGLGYL
jgi:predicted AlkP superfamily phosphohydrolase/phosphomutase